MPKLRNLRIINAQFNEGKNIYEDFRMPFQGFNATFELVNGGGKSVLLMLLMQCILPKSALTPERPFKDMFHGGDVNRTTHVLAEWELEEGISDKKYLLTGFCAKRKIIHDEDTSSDEIQSFNYLINYSKSNDFDINNIRLCSYENKEFLVRDYSKTLSMLKEKGSEYNIRITEKKREYLEWLKTYNLLESEWNLIREINRSENHLKPHFVNYKSSRTLVEGLLIKTIEECLKDRSSLNYDDKGIESSSIAEALFTSQEQLKKLQEEQETLNNYDKLLSEVNNLNKANTSLINAFNVFEEVKTRAAAQFNAYEIAIQKNEDNIRNIVENLEETKDLHDNLSRTIEKINLLIFNIRVNHAKKQKDQYENEIAPLNNAIIEQNKNLNFSRATNKYLLIRDNESLILENENVLANKKENQQDLIKKINPLGKTLFHRISVEITQTNERKIAEDKILKEIQEKNKLGIKDLGGKENQSRQNESISIQLRNRISKLRTQYDDLIRRHTTFPQISSGLFIDDKIDAVTKFIVHLDQEETDLIQNIESVREKISQQNLDEHEFKNKIESERDTISRIDAEFVKFKHDNEKLQKIFVVYGKEETESCISYLEREIEKFNENLILQKNKILDLNQRLNIVQQYGFSLDKDFVQAVGIMKERYPQSVSGAEFLRGLPEARRSEVLDLAPWIPNTMLLLDQFFKEIIRAPYTLPVEIQEISPILASIDLFRMDRPITLGDVFIPHRDANFSKDVLTKEKTIARMKKDIVSSEENVSRIQLSIKDFSQDLYIVRSFSDHYNSETESELSEKLIMHQNLVKEFDDKLCVTKEQKIKNQEICAKYLENVKENKERQKLFKDDLGILQDIKKTEEDIRSNQENLEKIEFEQKELDTSIRQSQQEIERTQIDLNKISESIRQSRESLENYRREIREYQPYAGADSEIILERDTNEIRSDYRAIKKVVDEVVGTVGEIESAIATARSSIEGYQEDIKVLNISLDELAIKNPVARVSDDFIHQLQEKINDLGIQRNAVNALLEKAKEEYQIQNHELKQKIVHYQTISSESYSPNSDILESGPFIEELAKTTKEIGILENQITSLKADKQQKENTLKTFQAFFTEYRVLNGTYNFKNSLCNPADQFLEPDVFKGDLERSFQGVKRGKNRCENAKNTAIQNVSEIYVATEFKEIIKYKLKESGSLQEAESNQKQLNDFSHIIREKIGIHTKTIEALKEVEANIVNQAIGMAIIYRDYLKDFPQMSKLDIDGKIIEMVRINFDECIYPDDRARSEMGRYIQVLNKGIRDGTIKRQDLQKSFRPEQLVGRVMEMGKIQVKIRKIEEGSQIFQKWDMIKASDGQENTMYIIFLIALMSYIRNIVVGRYDKNTSKVLLLDNPFGSTGAFYLWAPIWSILTRNNIQLICSGHKISSKIREFFPVHHILTEEISKRGLRRISIKVEASGEAKEIIDRSQPKTILQWTGSNQT